MPPSFPRDIQPVVLRETSPTPFRLRLLGCHHLWRAIPGHFDFPEEAAAGPCNSTSPSCFHDGFGLPYSPFGRPYLGNPYWFLFLPLLRCFNSGVPAPCPERQRFTAGRRSHSAIPGSTATCAYPGLIAACHGLLQRPSRGIHQAASLCRVLFGASK